MNFQGSDPEGSKPNGPRLEEDLERPLRAVKSVSHRRLPAALPFALAGILVVSSVAFGATVVRSLVTPNSSATPIVVGDDNPTDGPTLAPTEVPSEGPVVTEAPVVTPEPGTGALTLTGVLSGSKVSLTWSAYAGDDFAYYKVVRSTDTTAEWPLGDNDKLVAAISNVATLSFLDAAPAATVLSYAVFAVSSGDTGYEVLAASNVVEVLTPAVTPAPTKKNCNLALTAQLIAPTASVGGALPATYSGDYSIKLRWSKYLCASFQWYGIQMSQSGTPVLGKGDNPNLYYSDNINALSWTYKGVPSGTYYFRAYAFTEKSYGGAGDVRPACNVGTILGYSNVVKVVVP